MTPFLKKVNLIICSDSLVTEQWVDVDFLIIGLKLDMFPRLYQYSLKGKKYIQISFKTQVSANVLQLREVRW